MTPCSGLPRYVLLALLVPTLLAAATPAARHLRYAFAVNGTWQASDAGAGDFSGPDSGVVDIALLPGKDGGTLVQATEQWWNRLRPEQTVTCDLFPSGSLNCNQLPAPSLIEVVLLPLLAPKFFAGLDASTWTTSYEVTLPKPDFSLSSVATLSVQKSSESVVQIELRGKSRLIEGPRTDEAQSATILFDRASSLPVSIRERWSEASVENGGGDATIDLKLLAPKADRTSKP
jgi:hypothetical protein